MCRPQTICVLLSLVLSAPTASCRSNRSGSTRPAGAVVLIPGVPHVKRKPGFSGEACAAMALAKFNARADQDYVFSRSGVDPVLGRGCRAAELVQALKNIGFDPGLCWYKIWTDKADEQMKQQWLSLLADLKKGLPTIIAARYDGSLKTAEHFRLVLGYDPAKDEVIYHEPAKDNGAYLRMPRKTFLSLWPLKNSKQTWTVIRMPLRVKRLVKPPPAAAATFTAADYAQHMRKLKPKIPKGFHVTIRRPFIVLGDESPYRVEARARGTVEWAVRMLKKDYFKKDPTEIIDVWLFKDKASYLKHNRLLFNTTPTTPYGYYSSTHKALVMNIATGGGTLVHEIVHPFIASNFPECPAWFNEGLASLYEQCEERRGHIHGRTNWRLAGLQKGIRAGKASSFKDLTSTTSHQFYNQDRGTNYSQARYLCYYLQEKGLLVQYYHAFHAARRTDPTGYETLKKTLDVSDMAAFKKQWQAWTLKLRFP